MGKNFSKNVEDFDCLKCGFHVIGTGYTDHCPKCLYSMHVDINPGDRECACRGLMKPVKVSLGRSGTFTIYYVCEKCGISKRVKASDMDDKERLFLIAEGSKIT